MTVAHELGLSIVLPTTGEWAVILVDEVVLPGMCYEEDDVLWLPLDLQHLNDPSLGHATKGPIVLVSRKDPSLPPHAENVHQVGTMFACSGLRKSPDGRVSLTGYALESAKLNLMRAPDGQLGAEIELIDWAPGILQAKEQLRSFAKTLDVAEPNNLVMWVAAFATLGGRLPGQSLAAVLEGPHAAIEAIEALTAVPTSLPPPTTSPSPELLAAYQIWALPVLIRQLALVEKLSGGWNIDIDTQELILGESVYPLHLLGTTNPEETEFLWSWAPQGMAFPDPILVASRGLRTQDIPEFQQTLVPLTGQRDMLFIVQSGIDGRPYYYGKGPVGPGVQCLVDTPLTLTAPVLLKALSQMPMMDPPITNHVAAIESGVEALGLSMGRDGNEITIQTAAHGRVLITLDDHERVSSVEALLRASHWPEERPPKPQEQEPEVQEPEVQEPEVQEPEVQEQTENISPILLWLVMGAMGLGLLLLLGWWFAY